MDLYQELILEHSKRPHHAGLREPFGAEVHHVNPTCGDEVTLRVAVDGSGPDAVVRDVVRRTERVSAAFIKELMRRAVQCSLERGGTGGLEPGDVELALDELFVRGGSLNLTLLGADGAGGTANDE